MWASLYKFTVRNYLLKLKSIKYNDRSIIFIQKKTYYNILQRTINNSISYKILIYTYTRIIILLHFFGISIITIHVYNIHIVIIAIIIKTHKYSLLSFVYKHNIIKGTFFISC